MRIGNLTFHQPVILAPMEDVTDAAFRYICRKMGADIVLTEFTASEAIIRDIPRAMSKIQIYEEERPVAIQLFGGNEEAMAEAARKATELKPDFLDINCGCWVKNVVARNEGAGLLRDLPKMERIVRATIEGTHLPVTVKTRLGWDEQSIVILDVARMLEDCGVKALTVHCRTRSQAHDKAPADWSWLSKLKKAVTIPIIGNGDVQTPEDVKAILETGCDGVMIGRAAIGNPWIFQQAKEYLATGSYTTPTLKERIEVIARHLKLAEQYQSKRDVIRPFRKFYAGYLKGMPNIAKLRADLMRLDERSQIVNRLQMFHREAQSLNFS